MKMWFANGKRAALAALFLFSCSSPQPQWEYIKTPEASSISYATDNSFKGIDLEIIRSASGDRMYASVHASPLPSDNLRVTLAAADDTAHFEVYRFEGGQRLLLPNNAIETLISLLENHRSIKIQIGRYEQTITAESFKKSYRQLAS